MAKNWVAVASAEHVRIGRTHGFMQVNHGKLAPLMRLNAGDKVTYYSPTTVLGQPDKLQSFTAIGMVKSEEPYQASMHGGNFLPYRRDVTWCDSLEAPIRPLLELLDFSRGKTNWGYQMRFGLFEITPADITAIAQAMQCDLSEQD